MRKRKDRWLIAGFSILMLSMGCAGSFRGSYILDKAAKAMDKTKYYKVKVTVEIEGVKDVQLKEISGNDLHWQSQTRGEEQFYIDGVLHTRVSHGGWRTEKVSWSRAWKEVNNLNKAKDIKLAGRKKVEGLECFVVTYSLPFGSGKEAKELKATDYINARSYRYVKAIGQTQGYQETSIFYDYDRKTKISLPL